MTINRFAVAAGALLLAAASVARGDPTDLHLTALADWMELNASGGQVLPVRDWNEGLEGLHPGEQDAFRPANLYLVNELYDDAGVVLDPHPGLVMSWGSPMDDGEVLAAWELVLPVDPDLSQSCITLTAWPRTGMSSISFMLQDVNGVMKGWRWPVGGSGGLPENQGTTVMVRAAGGPGEGGSTVFWDGGIDLTQVVSFQFDESGMAIPGGIPLPNSLPGFVGQWNFWHDIMVLSCPGCPARPGRPNNGFGNGGGDGMPGNSAGRGAGGRHGPIDDADR